MTLRALHPIDCYTCLECGDLVSYRRGSLPTGWASTLCAPCDRRDAENAERLLSATVAEGLPPVDPDADVRNLAAHLDPYAADLSPREWMALSEADLVDLTDHLIPLEPLR